MTVKALFLQAPPGQLDPSMLPLIEKWDDEPTAIQILEVLDHCIHASLASGFAVSTMQALLAGAQKRENVTMADLVPLATWRNL